MNLYVINIVKTGQTLAYIIFRDGSMLTLYVHIYTEDAFLKLYIFYRLIILLLIL